MLSPSLLPSTVYDHEWMEMDYYYVIELAIFVLLISCSRVLHFLLRRDHLMSASFLLAQLSVRVGSN